MTYIPLPDLKNSKKRKKSNTEDEKIYTKKDLAKMLDAYCSHLLTAIMRKDDHVKIVDYINNPSLINQNG